jgi:hypothetical protein
MPAFMTFTIGSEEDCDIHLDQSSIAASHAELVIAGNGKLHLTDRASEKGTFRKRGDRWVQLKQDYVQPAEPLRFGDYHTSVSALMSVVAPNGADALLGDGSNARGAGGFDPKSSLPTGRVRRSVDTGEIIAVEKY